MMMDYDVCITLITARVHCKQSFSFIVNIFYCKIAPLREGLTNRYAAVYFPVPERTHNNFHSLREIRRVESYGKEGQFLLMYTHISRH